MFKATSWLIYLMGGDCSDIVKIWYPGPEVVKNLSKKKNRQKEYRMTLPNMEPQNYIIKRISRASKYVVFEPIGEAGEAKGMSDPYMGV